MVELACTDIRLFTEPDYTLEAIIQPYGDWNHTPEGYDALKSLVNTINGHTGSSHCTATLDQARLVGSGKNKLQHQVKLVCACESIEMLMNQKVHFIETLNKELNLRIYQPSPPACGR